MENLHQQMLERCKTLVYRELEIVEEQRTLELAKQDIQSELQAAKTYIQTSHDPVIKREFQNIANFKKDLMSAKNRTQKVVESKTHLVIRILQQHGRDGLDVDEILTLLPPKPAGIDRNYLTTILGKLRKKGMAIKERNKFFITTPAKPTTPLHLLKNPPPNTSSV